MRKILLILCIAVMSCSSDNDNSPQGLNLSGTWELVNGTFNGNNVSGVTDPFFNGTTFTSEDFDGDYLLKFTFPNAARGNAWVIDNDNGTHKSRPINDTGIKTSNSITTNYSGKEMLVSSNNDNIIIDIASDEIFEIEVNSNTMTWTRQSNGYTITYNFVN